MGATISVTNKSDVTVNAALKQVGVLYWKNCLAPGETVVWNVGKVWLTVEAIVDDENDGRTRYRELDRIMPIILTTGGVLAVAGGTVVAAAPILVGSGIAAAVGATTAGATVVADTAGAALSAVAADALLHSGAATATGAAAGAAAGAVAREVASIFGRKAVNTAADIAVGSAVGEVYKRYRGEKPLIKAKKYGVYAGNNPKLIISGDRKALVIEYDSGELGSEEPKDKEIIKSDNVEKEKENSEPQKTKDGCYVLKPSF